MPGSRVHLLCPILCVPTRKGVKQTPGSSKTRAEVSQGQGSVELVQRKIISRETLLPQSAAKHVNGIVAAGRSLGKSHSRHENRSRLANVRGRYSRVSDGCLTQRVFLQRDPNRLLQCEGRGIRGLLSLSRWQKPQRNYGCYSEFEGNLQLCTPVVWVVF